MNERFTTIKYSNESLFDKKDNKITLKEWKDDLQFLANFGSSFDANFFNSVGTQLNITTSDLQSYNPFGFGKSARLIDTIKYDRENLKNITGEANISFWIRPENNNARCFQLFNRTTNFTIATDTVYSVMVKVGGLVDGVYDITLTPLDTTIADVLNKLSVEVANNLSASHDVFTYLPNGKIGFRASANGNEIKIEDVPTKNSLITFMNGITESFMPSAPNADVILFSIDNGVDNKDKIVLTHKAGNSNFHLKIYDKNQSLAYDQDLILWNNHSLMWNKVELSWKDNTFYFFLDGKLRKIVMLEDFIRSDVLENEITFSGNTADPYFFSEIVIFNKIKNIGTYNVDNDEPITKYYTTSDYSKKPYVEFNLGNGFRTNEFKNFNVICSPNLKFVVKNNDSWQYYIGGAWRISDASWIQSNEVDILDLRFKDLTLVPDTDLIFRVYFDSDGSLEAFLDDVIIERTQGAADFATLTGIIELNNPVNLSLNSEIRIATKDGVFNVDCKSAAFDQTAVIGSEIITAINNAGIPDLQPAYLDERNRIVLKTISTGSESTLQVYEGINSDGIPLVWGYSSSDIGTDATVDKIINLEPLFSYVRRKLGAPQMPVELTDEQLNDCFIDVLAIYKRWRDFKVSFIQTTLEGNPRDGWIIPEIVGGEENITDVVLKSVNAYSYYFGRDDLVGNIYMQQMFNRKGFLQNAVDYYLTLQANNDINIILNQQPQISYMNGRMFISPKPLASFNVIIKYKSPLSYEEIFNSDQIRKFMVAEAKITLGIIRSTFGNQVPMGDQFLTMNGDALKAEGYQEREGLIAELKGSTQVYEFIMG